MWIKFIFKKEQNYIKEKILKLEQKNETLENIVINDVKKDVSELKTDVSVLKRDVSELKTDVSILKNDMSELKTDFKILISRFDNFEKNFYNNQNKNNI